MYLLKNHYAKNWNWVDSVKRWKWTMMFKKKRLIYKSNFNQIVVKYVSLWLKPKYKPHKIFKYTNDWLLCIRWVGIHVLEISSCTYYIEIKCLLCFLPIDNCFRVHSTIIIFTNMSDFWVVNFRFDLWKFRVQHYIWY